jgi:hypothetical protein
LTALAITRVFVQAGQEQGTSTVKHYSATSQADTVLKIITESKVNSGSKEIRTGLEERYFPACHKYRPLAATL